MAAAYDLVVRGGTVADGSGGTLYQADIAVTGGQIAAVGTIPGAGREEIDARGKLVTPGFVDIHTHYDGQATWEQRMRPSSDHGVTTVVTGNCGVGFAPCRPEERAMLINLMEGVEDIPEAVMAEGLPWQWTSFPDFLDFLDQRRFDVDIGTQIPHSAVRVHVMGQRGADRAPASPAEIGHMSELVSEAIAAGAFGVTTSRHLNHRNRRGDQAPSIDAAERELIGLASGLRRAGAGVFQLIPQTPADPAQEFALMQRIVAASGRPLSFTLMAFQRERHDYLAYLDLLSSGQPAVAPIRGQGLPRAAGVLFGLDLSFHPFSLNPSYRPIAHLPLTEKVAAMRDPAMRARLLAEQPDDPNPFAMRVVVETSGLFRLGDPPNYAPPPQDELGAIAARTGVPPRELLYDALLEQDGRAILYRPAANFLDGHISAAGEIMRHPATIVALGDGGAHYGMICDGSYPTSLLTYWTREAPAGERVSLPWAIAALTSRPADAIGMTDRGRIAPGLKADLNVIDYDRLKLRAPTIAHDLPGGGKRLRQPAEGYAATIVSGETSYRNGEPTGALPGRLVRRGRPNRHGRR